ncbi:helix-turn-helix domain-containing protein [Nocardia jinanensis]|uniref:helix-turn-helix domain-containing protein n=1 Tax=Nocardia jinanensis TaxID=382504 RepID=UPI000A920474|nr:helix-turn-helix transcriptional regulator [Nocardia jinanensis]
MTGRADDYLGGNGIGYQRGYDFGVVISDTEPSVGGLLRSWRERRRLSQLQLASEAAVSTRHLSFVETGRSRPTREMVERLAGHLDVPLRERNELLLAAGYAPSYGQRDVDAPELRSVMDAFRILLDAHMPHPALVLDRCWDVVDRNAATDLLLDGCPPELLEPPVNAIRISLHPAGLAPRIRNLGQWRGHLLGQLRSRLDATGDPRLKALVDEVSAYPCHDAGVAARADVVIPLQLRVGTTELSFFSVTTSAMSATDVTIEELHIEAFYPADEATARAVLPG